MQQWISVKNRLPDLTDRAWVKVLAYDGYQIMILTYERGGGSKGNVYRWRQGRVRFSGVTHWMPLPKEPAAGKGGKP